MSDDAQREFREVQAHFRLPSIGLVEKDQHVVRAITALASLDANPFRVVCGGYSMFARRYKLTGRIAYAKQSRVWARGASR